MEDAFLDSPRSPGRPRNKKMPCLTRTRTRFGHRPQGFGLSSQMCRAAVSIPSNVAEGHCKSTKEFLHHITHSRASLHELMTLAIIAQRRRYGTADALERLTKRADHEGKLLFGLRRSLIA